MNETTKSEKVLSSREWVLVAALVVGAVLIVRGLVTTAELRKTIAHQETQIERAQSRVEQLENASPHLFAQAAKAQEGERFDDALSQYRRVVTEYPGSVEAGEAGNRIALIEKEVARRKAAAEAEAKRKKAEEEAKRRAYEESIKPPLQLVRAMVTFNAIDNPEARVVVRNVSRKTVDAYTIGFYCYDRYGNPVNHYVDDTNRFGGLAQRTLRPGQTTGPSSYWTLHGHENTAEIKAVLERVHMTDGSVWTPQRGQEIAVRGYSKK